MACRLTGLKAIAALFVVLGPVGRAEMLPSEVQVQQRLAYEADTIKTIFDLQPLRTQTRVNTVRADGIHSTATLVNLNPAVGFWYILELSGSGAQEVRSYHIENARLRAPLRVVASNDHDVWIVGTDGKGCKVQANGQGAILEAASRSGLPYAPLCDGALYLRNPVAGHRTSLERVTEFLREKVWGGEKIIGFVKKQFYRDAFLEEGAAGSGVSAGAPTMDATGPEPARVSAEAVARTIVPESLALDLENAQRELSPGLWYPVRDVTGVSVSTLAPGNIEDRIRFGHEASVNPLTEVEAAALVYLVAFDLRMLDLHFVIGTDHPSLEWSPRPPASSQDPRLPGPDGIASSAPVVVNGMVRPTDIARTVATFTGGFKRSHGAFRHGDLAQRNHGSHYGFIEEGVIFSKLQPGLATAVVMKDGRVDLRTWSAEDDAQLADVRDARQNGVPLIEYNPQRRAGVPGDFVNLWGPGNWSGSANEDLRTLRAGLCLQENSRGRFLVYAYFSAATPSAMARTFQAYGCRYALHLDMNALEHTYLAVYARHGGARVVEHLVSGMEVLDRSARGELAPRFLGFPDDRDFFYMTRKGSP